MPSRAPAHRLVTTAALAAIGACLLAPSGRAAPAPPPPASVFLEDMTWPELRDALGQGRTVAIVPIGGTEQSGPAMALGKHNARVRALAERIARELGDAVVAPVLAYAPEGNIDPPSGHMRFPGTLTVAPTVFEATLESVARSLRAHGFRDIVLLGDHGGYQAQLAHVAARLDRAWSAGAARVWAPPEYYAAASGGFAQLLRERGYRDDEIGSHAGLADTALQLATAPDTVRTALLASGARFDASVGVYGGDPRRATAEAGRLGADEIVRATVAAIRRLVERGRDPPAARPAAAPQ